MSSISTVHALGEVNFITTESIAAIPTEYTLDGKIYRWGQGDNLNIISFEYSGTTYKYETLADEVFIRRIDNGISTHKRCSLFAEKSNNLTYKATYPDDGTGTGNCDMAKVMSGRTINIGALDVFSNKGGPDSQKNIERIDFIYSKGIKTPNAVSLGKAGHVATEKSGNNYVQIAAILSVDGLGNPTDYGPLVMIHPHQLCHNPATDNCYGLTNIGTTNDFLSNNAKPPQKQVYKIFSSYERLGMAFVSLKDLNVPADSTYYGFSYFGKDVDTSAGHVLTDPSTFPLESLNNGVQSPGDADMYGGVAGYFIDDRCDPTDCPDPKVPELEPLDFGSSGRFNIQ